MNRLTERKNGWKGRSVVTPDQRDANHAERDKVESPSASDCVAEASTNNVPDPEVSAKARRRTFTAEYKLRILEEYEACAYGEVGALLRREGLYSSHIKDWQAQRDRGALQALEPKKRGRKPKPVDPNDAKIARLEKENKRLQQELRKAELTIDVQKKVSELLGLSLKDGNSEKSS